MVESLPPVDRRVDLTGPLAGLAGVIGRIGNEQGSRVKLGTGECSETVLVAPGVYLGETEALVHVRLELPGMDPQEINIQVSGTQLTVVGECQVPEADRAKFRWLLGPHSGRLSRGVKLPCPVDANRLDATYQDGVLNVSIPKSPWAKAPRYEVTATRLRLRCV